MGAGAANPFCLASLTSEWSGPCLLCHWKILPSISFVILFLFLSLILILFLLLILLFSLIFLFLLLLLLLLLLLPPGIARKPGACEGRESIHVQLEINWLADEPCDQSIGLISWVLKHSWLTCARRQV